MSLLTSFVTFYCGQFLFVNGLGTESDQAVSIFILSVAFLLLLRASMPATMAWSHALSFVVQAV